MTDKRILTTPIKAEDLQDINVGDIIYLNGYLVTCRDVAHRRLIEEKRPLPVDIDGGAILHAGPIIRSLGDDKYEMISVGPTTSMCPTSPTWSDSRNGVDPCVFPNSNGGPPRCASSGSPAQTADSGIIWARFSVEIGG